MRKASIHIIQCLVPVIAVLAMPRTGLSQALADDGAAATQQYRDLIEQRQDVNGVLAPDLLEPLTALGEEYFRQQDYERAAATFAQARQIMRVNQGLDTPQELPLLARQVAAEEARGNYTGAWELEEGLLNLAESNIGSPEAVPVFIAAGNKRIDVWNRYRNGDHPPEIELGCYYNRMAHIATTFMREPLANTVLRQRSDCNSGERRNALVSLLIDARKYQMLGVESLLRNGRYGSEEMRTLVTDVLRTSQGILARQLSFADPSLAEMMMTLINHEPEDAAEVAQRAQFLLELADMNVVRLRQTRRIDGFDTLREQYEQVWRELEETGVPPATLEALFHPELPVVLPGYAENPLTRVDAAQATGYIDISFEITFRGRSQHEKVIGTSADLPRGEVRNLTNLLFRSSFRPRMVDGKVLDSAPVILRYYVNGR